MDLAWVNAAMNTTKLNDTEALKAQLPMNKIQNKALSVLTAY